MNRDEDALFSKMCTCCNGSGVRKNIWYLDLRTGEEEIGGYCREGDPCQRPASLTPQLSNSGCGVIRAGFLAATGLIAAVLLLLTTG